MEHITKYRDKVLAHIDDRYLLNISLDKEENNKIKIILGDIKDIQKDIEDIVNEISIAYNGVHQEFKTLDHNDTTRLLNDIIKWLYKS